MPAAASAAAIGAVAWGCAVAAAPDSGGAGGGGGGGPQASRQPDARRRFHGLFDSLPQHRPSRGASVLPPPTQRRFVSVGDDYGALAFAPGDEACWENSREFECVAADAPTSCGSVAGGDGFEYVYEGQENTTGLCPSCPCCRRRSAGLLSFEACCNGTRGGRGNPACWARSGGRLSFARCCSAAAFRPSPLPRRRRVVVSLSTTPHRLHHLELVLMSLANQTHRADLVYLVLPYLFLRDWAWYDVPWWYTMLAPGLIRIARCEQDFRAATALLCVLQYEPDPDTYIVVVDDDILYHPLLIESLLNKSASSPGAMVGAMAYGRAGAWCRQHDAHGVCVLPNLAHTTYGLLLQRRFFDAGILNLAAAAHAYIRQRPDRAPKLDYIVTSCAITDNTWYEAHLASKGIPRVYLKDYLGARPVGEIAFGRMSLFAGYQETYFHNADDPHTIAQGEKLCMQAMQSLWGTSLWTARPRHVAAAMLPRGGGAEFLALALSQLPWWRHDAAVIFTCMGLGLAGWRQAINAHGGLHNRVTYLHLYAPGLRGPRVPFVSELLDPSAFVPEPLQTHLLAPNERGFRPPGAPPRGFRPSGAVPGRETAGSLRPLADVVELCSEDGAPAALPREQPLPACPKVRVVRNACAFRGKPSQLEEMPGNGIAAVRCCYNNGRQDSGCTPNWIWRNVSWLEKSFAVCLPQSANYFDAHRICEAIGLQLCTPEGVVGCCRTGCNINDVAWLHSPEAVDCLRAQAKAARRAGASPDELAERATSLGIVVGPADKLADEGRPLRARQDLFLSFSEEARSTVVQWVTAREP